MHCYMYSAYTVNMNHDAHAIVRGISKMFQKMVELGIRIHVHTQRKATK